MCKGRPRRHHWVVWFSKKLSKVGRQSDKEYFDDYGNSCEKEDDDGDEKEKYQSVMYRTTN